MNIKFIFLRVYHIIFSEKFYKKITFLFNKSYSRFRIIQETIIRKSYKSYLEIGCDQDLLFSKIKINFKVGVDPVSGGTIRDTSDNFFKKCNTKFDIIFIDGLHLYDQVYRDINNSLLFLNDNGVIFINDCLPARFIYQAIPRAHSRWNGDVWKNIVELRTRSEIDTYVIYADYGMGMILKRQNRKLLKLDISDFKKLKYKDFFYNYKEYLNLIEFEDLKNIF